MIIYSVYAYRACTALYTGQHQRIGTLSNNLLLTMKLPVWKPHMYHNINMLDVESVPGEPSDSFPPNIHEGGGGGKGGGARKDTRS